MGGESKVPAWKKGCLNLNKFTMWPLGIWPSDTDSFFSYVRLAFCIYTQLWMVGTQGIAFFLKCGDVADLVDYIMMAICAILGLTKMLAIKIHMDKLKPVFNAIRDEWTALSDDIETRQVAKPFIKTGRKVFFIQMTNCYVSNSLIVLGAMPFLMPPMDNETLGMDLSNMPSRQLPMRTGCMFAESKFYTFLYVFEGLMINVTANSNVGCDVFLIAVLMHLCGRIELLKIKVLKIGKLNKDDLEKTRDHIVECISQHTEILESCQAVNDTCSTMLVVLLGLSALMYLMLGIRIIMAINSGALATAARPLIAFAVNMIQMYVFSYASDRLSQQGESLVTAFYQSNWYELPNSLRKDVMFAMARANKPIYLVAGSFYTMSVENVMNILKASFSYFNFIRVAFEEA